MLSQQRYKVPKYCSRTEFSSSYILTARTNPMDQRLSFKSHTRTQQSLVWRHYPFSKACLVKLLLQQRPSFGSALHESRSAIFQRRSHLPGSWIVLNEFYSPELMDIDSGGATPAATIDFIAKTIHTIIMVDRSTAIRHLLDIEVKLFVGAVGVSACVFGLTSAVIS
jgi:hypothetical protein